MRQVPEFDAGPIGIVGDGRVARHFLHYLNLLGLSVRAWSRRAPAAAGPTQALASCEIILLLIRDTEIVPFIAAWPALQEKRLVHFSGSLVTQSAEGVHPLMTFRHELYDLATYCRIPFILDSGGTPFHQLLPGLPNPSFTIPAAERPYYHALCVMAGNFSTILWLKLFDELEVRFGIPASAAHPYLAQMAANLLTDAGRSLTGPLSRGDSETIDANLKALDGDPFQGIYHAFVRVYEQRS
jgi:2-dehydropantoate 2-reductase